MLSVNEVAERSDRILTEIERAVVGKRDALELVLLGFLANGHVLVEDFPGLAKTLIARSFAQVCDMDFSRIQFTPDLMPSDVTGSSVYNQRTTEFEFRPGPIFTNLLLGDEINRAPPKTQAALLEAMQERQVTIEGTDDCARAAVPRDRDAEPDRVRGHVPVARGAARPLPAAGSGSAIRAATTSGRCSSSGSRGARTRFGSSASPIAPGSCRCRTRSSRCTSRRRSATTSSTSSRRLARASASRSARARAVRSRCVKLSRCRAALQGRDFVTPEDVKAVAVPALSHRLMLRPELWVQRVQPEDVVREVARHGADAGGGGPRGTTRMSRAATPKLGAYSGLAALALLAGLATRRPELVVIAAPFLLVAALGLLSLRRLDRSRR